MKDLEIAKKYMNKAQNAKSLGHEFSLSFSQFKRLMIRKKCFYTGVLLNDRCPHGEYDFRTIDRVDNSKGYIPGNVVACTYAANNLKGFLENPKNPCSISTLKKMSTKL